MIEQVTPPLSGAVQVQNEAGDGAPDLPMDEVVGEKAAAETTSEISIAWQIWQPILLALPAAIVSNLTWETSVAGRTGFDSAWWLDNGGLLFSGGILFGLLVIGSLFWFSHLRERFRFLLSVAITLSLSIIGVLIAGLACWPFLLISWLLISLVWSRYRLSPWRNGVWVGLGGGISLVLWGILSFVAFS